MGGIDYCPMKQFYHPNINSAMSMNTHIMFEKVQALHSNAT